MCRSFFFYVVFLLSSYTVLAQVFPLSNFSIAAEAESLELAGKIHTGSSYLIKPVRYSRSLYDSLLSQYFSDKPIKQIDKRKWVYGRILPISNVTKYTSHHPFGWSDGALLPSKGLQQLWSAGVYGEAGPISIQLNPEFIWASNQKFERYNNYGPLNPIRRYNKIFLGQTFIKFEKSFLGFSFGADNKWWGPGYFSSLIMSNNAPGNINVNFYSPKPFNSHFGKFEWQIIGGKLKDDPQQIDEIYSLNNLRDIYQVEKINNKYLNSLIIVYHPFFLKDAYIAFTRSFIGQYSNVDSLGKNDSKLRAFLPVFDRIFKSNLLNEDQREWNQLASLSLKIKFPKAHAETYVEYGWNDHSENIRDLLMAPTHSASYLVGFRKIIHLNKSSSFEIITEINQMAQSPDYLVRSAGNWYIHWYNTNYSNFGQILGSGIGFGNNAFSISNLYKKNRLNIGFLFHKIQQLPNDRIVRWSDYAWGLQGKMGLKNISFSYKFYGVKSKNYAWVQDVNRFNFIGMLGVGYLIQ